MNKIRLRIPSPETVCVLYVVVNLIKVKRTSIAVVVALTILYCVRINVQVRKTKYVRTHTQRHFQHRCICQKYVLYSAGNHGEGVELRKLIQHIYQLLLETSQSEK